MNAMKEFNIKKHIMTGISYMIPIVVIGGLCMGLGKLLGGWDVGSEEKVGTMAAYINTLGAYAMAFVVPALTAGIAYSISGRPGIAPGLAIGYAAVQVKAGFLGGILMGILIGLFVNWMKTWKVPSWLKGLMPVMIIPFLTTLVLGMAFLLIIGKPITGFMEFLTAWIRGLNDGSKFVIGAVIGACMGFDMGGPVNKTASAVANGLGADGIFGPMTAKIVGGMTPPLGIGLAALVANKKFSKAEVEMAKTAVPMGFSFITEGVLPFAAADPLRVIPSCMIGSGIAGGLAVMWGCESVAGHGGIFVVPMMVNPLGFMAALVIGSVTTGVTYALLKRPAEDEVEEEIVELDISVSIE
ncbi:PTS fructose transporter subunit IIC [Anaerotalea alkaliphila]|uniref:PTS fructose transporter subunit IIC n=1 Tax=Anaerotalea alkaliphila TaxID=2662126 RepID=A0A7X5HWF8_9FIRM|nr:PTS fructose transporter subunit IIC [Anaerotalea alkaliphila]NDL67851.1 PTS fructose transporter subunit IIC [Anaerotalea alkaliphila]